jgi:hypothetical protein
MRFLLCCGKAALRTSGLGVNEKAKEGGRFFLKSGAKTLVSLGRWR